MKIPFDELIQDVKSELTSIGFKINDSRLKDLNDVETIRDLILFLEKEAEMEKEDAFEFLFEICVEVE